MCILWMVDKQSIFGQMVGLFIAITIRPSHRFNQPPNNTIHNRYRYGITRQFVQCAVTEGWQGVGRWEPL